MIADEKKKAKTQKINTEQKNKIEQKDRTPPTQIKPNHYHKSKEKKRKKKARKNSKKELVLIDWKSKNYKKRENPL
jgi:hypothetical protein